MLIVILFIILSFIIFTPHKDPFDNIKSDKDSKLNKELDNISITDKRLFTPLQYIINDAHSNAYNMSELPITALEIKNVIHTIPKKMLDLVSGELSINMYPMTKPSQINHIPKYIKHDIPAKVYYVIKEPVEKYLYNKTQVCNSNTPCKLIYKLSRLSKITRTGTDIANYNYIIEGQILIYIKSRPIEFLVKYIASTVDTLTIHELELDGFGFKTLGYQEKEDINDPVYISEEPVGYQAMDNPLYLNQNHESPEHPPKVILQDKKTIQEITHTQADAYNTTYKYRCFEKGDIKTKAECERKYDKDNNPIVPSVWDKYCKNNTECPFYKANKNYPNKFGGCQKQKCEFPVGVKAISPRKYTGIDQALCGNCMSNSAYCCRDQVNKKIYPELKSPDYRFKDDYNLRNEYGLGT